MMQVEGYVQSIDTLVTKTGKTMYNVRVNGQKYGAGMYPPKFKQGDFISFTATTNGNFNNMETRTVTVKAAPPMPTPAAAPAASAPRGDSPNWDARQDTISKQSALNSALQMVEILVAAGGVVGLDKAKNAADKAGIVNDLVREYTEDFYFQNTGKEWEVPKGRGLDTPQDSGEEQEASNGWQ